MKRLWAVVAVIAVAALIGVGVWVVRGTAGDNPTDAQPTARSDGIPGRPGDAFELTVEYVFDGDTIEARIAQPNDIVESTEPVRIRLIGIDTPEGTPTPECGADEARAALQELLPEGSAVWASADKDPYDRYGRVLLYLWTDDNRFVNYELVASGAAQTLRVRPNVAYAELFTDAQTTAKADGAGQWGTCG